jgi:nucleotide-binding universal stress UspA family protein
MKILLATDGSNQAVQATEVVAKLFGDMQGTSVTVLFVKDLALPASTVPEEGEVQFLPDPMLMQQEMNELASSSLKTAEEILQKTKLEVSTRELWGRPADTIAAVAEQDGYDLIAMGSRGMGALAEIIVGSVSRRVLQRSRVPVLVIPESH